jgi:hypothetical protein
VFPPERISRFLTYLLRHRPAEYPIAFDRRVYPGQGCRQGAGRFPGH